MLAQQPTTALGTAFVSAQALAVLGLATREYAGLRKAYAAAWTGDGADQALSGSG